MNKNEKKLTISAFFDKRLTNPAGKFVLPINPEKYERECKVQYDSRPAHGSEGSEARYQLSKPEELKLDFLLDGTGTVYGYGHPKTPVKEQLKKLRKTVYLLEGKTHQPRYLRIGWKDFTFDCVMTKLKTVFTLFDRGGSPLRAKVSCLFVHHRETKRRVQEEGKSSPDLTHQRFVKSEHRLPLMTNNIYGSPAHYLEVARVNGLTSIRSLRVNKSLIFPPLSKGMS